MSERPEYHSDWIDHNKFFENISADETPHYRQYYRPLIVCLIGPTRFRKEYEEINEQETLLGKIVLSCGCWNREVSEEEKTKLDKLHIRKIDLADSIFVINANRGFCKQCNGWCEVVAFVESPSNRIYCEECHSVIEWKPYIGESTRRELAHAISNGKQIVYLNPME